MSPEKFNSADCSDTSEWQSYISSSHEPSALNRSSWISSKFTLSSCQEVKRRSAALSSLALPPVTVTPPESEYSDSQLSTVVHHNAFTGNSSRAVPEPSVLDKVLIDHVNPYNPHPTIFLFGPPTVIIPPPHPYTWESPYEYYTVAMGGDSDRMPNMPDLIQRLGSDEDAVRKMAAFKLQSLINDPAFAEVFIQEGGLSRLRRLILVGSGNTLAYALASFARLLELDLSDNRGWEGVDAEVVEKVVELVVCHPLVNILRGAMAILVSVVSRPRPDERPSPTPGSGGFQALKPAIAIYPQFLEMLVSRLSSADHALCANALQLINSLMRDAISNDPSENEWPKFIKRLQDLGVIKAVYVLMQSSALQDLAHPLLEFQALTKVLLRRWRDIPVDLQKSEHRRTIKAIHLGSNPVKYSTPQLEEGEERPRHNPHKWRRLGFTTESPEPDFEGMGFLGMMDLSDFVRKQQDEFQQILQEQATLRYKKRCPIARASLLVSAVLYEHFEVDRHDWEDSKAYMQLESRTDFEKVFKPLLLHWSRLHLAGLRAFFRLWKATGAEMKGDLVRILELVRIMVESVVGGAARGHGIEEVEKEMEAYEVGKLRGLQMELLELTYEDVWGPHLRGVREELMSEALQFVKEQRVRCLLGGGWFPVTTGHRASESGPVRQSTLESKVVSGWRFVRLSSDRKYLHYGDYSVLQERTPELEELGERIDLGIVSSVVSNVTATDRDSMGSDSTLREVAQEKLTTTKITIHGYLPDPHNGIAKAQHRHKQSQQSHSPSNHKHTASKSTTSSPHARTNSRSTATAKESILLTIHPQSQTVASEWLDGLLMLLNQQPITAETNKLVQMIGGYGLKVRLLNVRGGGGEDEMVTGMLAEGGGPVIPSREGCEDEYYYRM